MTRIRDLLARSDFLPVPLASLSDTDDLYDAGLTSFASVKLMLALEEEFDIEFPEKMLNRRTFATIAAIERSVGELAGATV